MTSPTRTDREEAEMTATTPAPTTLPPGMLACASCGIAALRPTDPAEVVTVPRSVDTLSQRRDAAPAHLSRCGDGRALRDRASELVSAHPRIPARLGTVAHDHAEGALVALVLLGQRLPEPESTTEAEVRALLTHLAAVGSAARWQLQGGAPGQSAPHPWSHVSDAKRVRVRTAYAALLRARLARMAPPVRIAPPPLDPYAIGSAIPLAMGCLLCGVGEVVVPAGWLVGRPGRRDEVAQDVWRPLTTSPSSLGGRASPSSIIGHACPSCSAALNSCGAVGPSALETALITFLADSGRQVLAARLRQGELLGLVGWGVLAYDAHRRQLAAPLAPNREPWGHLDLSAVNS